MGVEISPVTHVQDVRGQLPSSLEELPDDLQVSFVRRTPQESRPLGDSEARGRSLHLGVRVRVAAGEPERSDGLDGQRRLHPMRPRPIDVEVEERAGSGVEDRDDQVVDFVVEERRRSYDLPLPRRVLEADIEALGGLRVEVGIATEGPGVEL